MTLDATPALFNNNRNRRCYCPKQSRRTNCGQGPFGVNQLSGDNSSFEGGLGNWSTSAGGGGIGTSAQSSDFSRTGTKSLKTTVTTAGIVSATFGAQVLTPPNPVMGMVYRLTGWVYPTVNAGSSKYYAGVYFDLNGTFVQAGTTGPLTTCPLNTWTQVSVLCTVSAGHALNKIYLGITQNNASLSDIFYIDDVELVLVSYDWGKTQGQPPPNSRSPQRRMPVPVRRMTKTPAMQPFGVNLLSGDSNTFEGGIGNVANEAGGNCTFTSSTDQSVSGTHSLKCVVVSSGLNAGPGFGTIVIPNPVLGLVYRLDAWIYPTNSGSTFELAAFFNLNGTFKSSAQASVGVLTANQWTRVSMTFTVPQSLSFNQFVPTVYQSTATTGNIFYVDDAELHLISYDWGKTQGRPPANSRSPQRRLAPIRRGNSQHSSPFMQQFNPLLNDIQRLPKLRRFGQSRRHPSDVISHQYSPINTSHSKYKSIPISHRHSNPVLQQDAPIDIRRQLTPFQKKVIGHATEVFRDDRLVHNFVPNRITIPKRIAQTFRRLVTPFITQPQIITPGGAATDHYPLSGGTTSQYTLNSAVTSTSTLNGTQTSHQPLAGGSTTIVPLGNATTSQETI